MRNFDTALLSYNKKRAFYERKKYIENKRKNKEKETLGTKTPLASKCFTLNIFKYF